ncbi:hypothetical protein RUM43_009042 [Polyplax serrata]|uniref:Uncharacterized protein n=1 Tax=Polyplax serrata TaxID=468196 RepID=A0AAN8NUP7_POLSC
MRVSSVIDSRGVLVTACMRWPSSPHAIVLQLFPGVINTVDKLFELLICCLHNCGVVCGRLDGLLPIVRTQTPEEVPVYESRVEFVVVFPTEEDKDAEDQKLGKDPGPRDADPVEEQEDEV